MHEQSQLQKDDSDGPLLNAEPASEATREDDDIEMNTYTYSHAHDSIGPGQASAEEGSPLLSGKTLANENRHGTQGKNPGRSRRIDWYMNLVAFLSLATMMACAWLSIFSTTPPPRIWIALHAPLTSLALLFFGCGILTLQPTSFADMDEKKRGLVRHQLFMLVPGVSSLALGFAAIWFHKASGSGKHWTTWHAVFGTVTLSCLVLHIMIGASSVWFKGRAFGSEAKAKSVWKYHRLAGYLLYGLFLGTAHLGGMYSNLYTRNTHPITRFIGFTLSPLIAAIAISARIRLEKMAILN